MQSEHVSVSAAAASHVAFDVKAVPSVQSDGAPTHEFGYSVLSGEQKAKPIVSGDVRQDVHVEKTALGGCASALQPSSVFAMALVHEPVVARHA